MSAPAQPGAFGKLFDLDKTLVNQHFLDGNGALTVEVLNNADPAALQSLQANAPLGNTELIIDKLQAKAGASIQPVKFLSGNGSVSFNGSGSAYAEIGVFPDPTSANFTNAIGPIADTKFTIPADPSQTVVLLCWGANADAAGKGSIAFASGAGTLDFSADAKGELFFGIAQQTKRTTPIDDALTAVVQSWKLPVHVRTAADLAPRTHIMAETGGSLTASIAATFGHQFNWVREINDPKLGTILHGDVGLKIQLDLKATFGLSLEGRYAVVVSRETEAPVIRVRIYKLKVKEFDFAFSASAAATATVPLPANFDDLLSSVDDLAAAALGVHPLQILKELEDPNAIQNWIDKYTNQYVSDLLQKFTGLTLDAAEQKLQSFVQLWSKLPSNAATLFAKLVEKEVPTSDLSQIKQIANLVANQDANGLKALLQNAINDLDAPFLSTPAGQYLEGLADQGALSLLDHIPPEAQDAAQRALNFLNGQDVATLLNNIETEIEKRLGIQTILGDISSDPQALDKMLLAKLTTFLGKTPVVQDIQKLQTQLKTLIGKAGTLYDKTVQALNNTYTAQLNATYQQTTTDTALIDASFDFSNAANSAAVQAALANLLAGRLDDFLMKPCAGVTLSTGALTHNVKRHSHVDLTLPFFSASDDVLNAVNTQFNAVDQQNGRLITYQFNAQDQQTTKVSWWNGHNWRSTTLSLSGQLSELLPTGSVRVYAATDADRKRLASGTSSLRMAVAGMSLGALTTAIQPFATQFLPASFPNAAAFTNWAAAGHLLDQPGNTLISFDVSVPPEAILAWFDITATDQKQKIYQDLSTQVQFLLKKYLKQYYFRSLDKYANFAAASIVLMYASIPPSTALASANETGVYWNPTAPDQLNAMIGAAGDRLKANLQEAHDHLIAAGRADLAKSYDPQFAVGNLQRDMPGNQVLKDLLVTVEAPVVHAACDAAQAIATFNQQRNTQPQQALKALADFGHKLTAAFNTDIGEKVLSDNDALRRISPLIFAQATKAINPNLNVSANNALLTVTVLKPGVALPSGFPDLTVDRANQLVSRNAASFSPTTTAAAAQAARAPGPH